VVFDVVFFPPEAFIFSNFQISVSPKNNSQGSYIMFYVHMGLAHSGTPQIVNVAMIRIVRADAKRT